MLYLFHKKSTTLSFMPVSNHQATDSWKNKFTIIVLESNVLRKKVELTKNSIIKIEMNSYFTINRCKSKPCLLEKPSHL